MPVSSPSTYLDDIQPSSGSEISNDESDFCYGDENNEPQVLGQSELNDLVRDLGLAKESTELLGSIIKSKNMLAHGTLFFCYCHREKVFAPYFDQENNLVYCTDPGGLVEKHGICYKHEEWRIFIDSSKGSLKAVLLHNSNKYASIPVGYSVIMIDSCENLVVLLDRINYKDHD